MKKVFTILSLTFLMYSSAQDCGGRYQSEIYSTVDVTTVDFGEAINIGGDTQTLSMDIYQGTGDTATDRPVVIFCFGGSFVGGARNSGELVNFATSLAKKGYVCASIDYRLAESPIQLISQEVMVKVVFQAVQDGKAAIRYFRKDADTGNSLGIDADQIFIGGTSAGGILAINLAYVDSLHKLPTAWQEWAWEIGGLEGNSGNPGYCSYPNGVFAFAGAVGDTSYMNANDVPFYGNHATGDQTVQYGYGAPLQGLAPVSLYGSGLIETRMNNLGIYHQVDTYSGGDHPPLGGANMATTNTNLTNFFFNILECNPNNMKKVDQQGCDKFYIPTPTGIRTIDKAKDWTLFPNPANTFVTIKGFKEFQEIEIMDALGRTIYSLPLSNQNEFVLDISDFPKGIYYVKLLSSSVWQAETLLIE